ncbi:hypothetical protein LCGC14_1233060, partial [marine sediment metagenome]
ANNNIYDVFIIGTDVFMIYSSTQWETETAILRPNGDAEANWETPVAPDEHWDEIDEAVTQPTAGDGNLVYNSLGNEYDIYEMTSGGINLGDYDGGVISKIRIWVYFQRQWSYPPDLQLEGKTNKIGATTYTGFNHFTGGVFAWKSITFSGLAWGQADLDDLEIYIHGKFPYSYEVWLDTMYAEITFSGDNNGELNIKNIAQGSTVSQSMGSIGDRFYDISQVVVDDTNAYFNWQREGENTKLMKYDSNAGTITEIKDSGPNTELPPDDMRGISYDGNDIIYFVLQDTSDLKYYLYDYEISTDTLTKGTEYNISLMLERNAEWYEKAFDMQSGEVYQVTENGLESFANSNFDAPIIAITDSYLMTSNGKLYEKNFDSTINFTVNLKNNGEPNDTLYYSFTTVRAIPVNVSIWNYDISAWDLVDSGIFIDNLVERTFLINSSHYHPTTYDINLRFVASSDTSIFNLYLDELKLKSAPLNPFADITQTITNGFLNQYDGVYPNYKDFYDINTTFNYRFTKNITDINDFAEFTIDGNTFSLTKDGLWNQFSEVIVFDSTLKDDFDVMFKISNGFLELDNMGYEYKFKFVDLNDQILLQQDFEIEFTEEESLLPLRNFKNIDFLIYNSYTFTTSTDGDIYYNTYGRTDKLEIIYKIKANGQWYSSIHSTSVADSGINYFNVSRFMLDNHLTVFQDFAIEYVVIGDNSELTVDYITLNCSTYSRQLQEFYRIIDNNLGAVSEWILFNSSASTITILDDFGKLPSNFTIEYKVVDVAGTVGINTTYNGEYNYILYSEERSITLDDDEIDLNSQINRGISFANTGQFNDILYLDAYINGFKYGTAYLDSGFYKLSFGTENSVDTLFGYSDSLLTPYTYSNIDPLKKVAWEVRNDDYFAVVKHVLIDDDIIITIPLTYTTIAELSLEHLYDRGFGLPDFLRMKEAYYYNASNDERIEIPENDADYLIDTEGIVQFLDHSIVHELYQNITDVKDGVIYFDYYTSQVSETLKLSNADGFFINFTMPAVYYDHTTIQKLTIIFNDLAGNSYSKTFYDLDLRKYYLDAVKAQYETDIFGLGKMMVIPLYVSLNEIILSNPNAQFDLSQLESIMFSISDSERWPGSFLQNFEQYSVLNLPYQRVGILDLSLYNLISDSIDVDDDGYANSTVVFKAPDYYNFYAESNFKIKRLDIEFTDLKVFAYGEEISQGEIVDVEYGDFIVLNYRWNDSLNPIILNDLVMLPITMINDTSKEILGFSSANWVNKFDYISLDTYYRSKYYYSTFQAPMIFDTYDVSFASIGTPIFNISFIDSPSFTINVTQESLSETEPIYLSNDYYELEYGHPLSLDGIILDNDNFWVEDEVYQYNYTNALDGTTTQQFNIITPLEDDEFIDKDEFTISYMNNKLEKVPLYSSITGNGFKDITILNNDEDKDPVISYVDNAYILNIYWEVNATNFINYDTLLMISYKILKGRPISPISFPSTDSYGNSLYDNLIEIPFAKYDMLSRTWKTEDNFTEKFSLKTRLLYEDIESPTDSIIIDGPKYQENQLIQTGIISIDSVYINKSNSDEITLVNSSTYNWSITIDGKLNVSELDYVSGDIFRIYYLAYYPTIITHPINRTFSQVSYIKVTNQTGYEYTFVEEQDYKISKDGYTIYFLDLYNTIIKNNFTFFDIFEIQYNSSLSRKIDLSQNILLILKDEDGKDIPIDNINVDILGLFEYSKKLEVDSPLSLPLGGGKQLVHLNLKYLPTSVFNKSSGEQISINYENVNGDKLYPYIENDNWMKSFTVLTIPDKVKLSLVNDITQNIVI